MNPASLVITRKNSSVNHTIPGVFAMGTASAALALSLALCGCKGGPATPPADDASLNTAIQTRIQSDPGLAGQPVQVAVQDGVATLTGNVSNLAARSLAANDASQIPGVRTVRNSLILGVPPTTPEVLVTPPPAPVAPVSVRPTPVKGAARIKNPPPERTYNPPPPAAPIERQQNIARNQPPPPPPPPRPAAPSFRNITIPADTNLSVRITQTLDSATTQTGDAFSGVLASDVVIDGLVALPSGTRVTGRVNEAKDAGHFSGSSLLTVSLTGVSHRGDQVAISTDTFSKEGNGRGKNTAAKIGGGAAVGAILGGIFGGGKGAAIGAGAGGGLGAGANGVTRGQQVQIASESLVRFRLTNSVTVRVSSSETSNEPTPDLQRHDQ